MNTPAAAPKPERPTKYPGGLNIYEVKSNPDGSQAEIIGPGEHPGHGKGMHLTILMLKRSDGTATSEASTIAKLLEDAYFEGMRAQKILDGITGEQVREIIRHRYFMD